VHAGVLAGGDRGSNPSHFKDDPRNPVENVSWDDVQTFIAELNRRLPGLQARLPSEAEWEYACRAGTTTPFSFGDNITPDQVNYDGGSPTPAARRSESGTYRSGRVAAAEPLGPVRDARQRLGMVRRLVRSEYPTGEQVDPQGPQTGAYRVLRGGSWYYHGGNVRSADRYGTSLAYRNGVFIGFRLALGQQEPAEPA
jgi:sulfatase modifying factor 1